MDNFTVPQGDARIPRIVLAANRVYWSADQLDRYFVDVLTAAGGSAYPDGRPAALGAYSSTLDWDVLKSVSAGFTDAELQQLVAIYERCSYLTPIHRLLASWLSLLFGRRRAAAGGEPIIKESA